MASPGTGAGKRGRSIQILCIKKVKLIEFDERAGVGERSFQISAWEN